MSVVVAIKDKDKVWVGCDSQFSYGYAKGTLSNKNNYKIFKPSNESDVIIGLCGYVRDANILSCVDEYIEEITKLKDEVNFKYIVTKVVPKIFNILKENKRIIEKKDELEEMGSELIFVYRDGIYQINSDGCVIEIDDYVAIGSGARVAMGYLNQHSDNPKDAVAKAIKSTCTTDLYVNYPIILMNTKDDKIEIINGR